MKMTPRRLKAYKAIMFTIGCLKACAEAVVYTAIGFLTLTGLITIALAIQRGAFA